MNATLACSSREIDTIIIRNIYHRQRQRRRQQHTKAGNVNIILLIRIAFERRPSQNSLTFASHDNDDNTDEATVCKATCDNFCPSKTQATHKPYCRCPPLAHRQRQRQANDYSHAAGVCAYIFVCIMQTFACKSARRSTGNGACGVQADNHRDDAGRRLPATERKGSDRRRRLRQRQPAPTTTTATTTTTMRGYDRWFGRGVLRCCTCANNCEPVRARVHNFDVVDNKLLRLHANAHRLHRNRQTQHRWLWIDACSLVRYVVVKSI